MTTPSPEKMKAEVKKIFNQKIPSVQIVRIDAAPMVDSDGANSLRIRIIVNKRPPPKEARRLVEVADRFQTWLINHHDDRFPYFRLLSKNEEREIDKERKLREESTHD